MNTGFRSAFRYILRHIVRAPVKSALTAAVALFFVLASGFLLETIVRTEKEIDRLYNTVIVRAEIRMREFEATPLRRFGDVIAPKTVRSVLGCEFVQDAYVEAGHGWSVLIPPDADGAFPENWAEIIGYDYSFQIFSNLSGLTPLLAFNDLNLFMAEHAGRVSENLPGASGMSEDMHIEYAAGYDAASFLFTPGKPLPVILSEKTMAQRGLRPGDAAYINYVIPSMTAMNEIQPGAWRQVPVTIIGVHNGSIVRTALRDAALIPFDAMEAFFEEETGYTALKFSIAPAYGREMTAVRETLQKIADEPRAGLGVKLGLRMQDEELLTVVGSMEQNLSLLRRMVPAAMALSILFGAGLPLLLTLQNAKNAALMRVLGSSHRRSRAVLAAEPLLLCVLGAAIGLCALAVLGWGGGAAASLGPAGAYLAGCLGGSVLGAVFVTRRPPLNLLQARE